MNLAEVAKTQRSVFLHFVKTKAKVASNVLFYSFLTAF